MAGWRLVIALIIEATPTRYITKHYRYACQLLKVPKVQYDGFYELAAIAYQSHRALSSRLVNDSLILAYALLVSLRPRHTGMCNRAATSTCVGRATRTPTTMTRPDTLGQPGCKHAGSPSQS